MEFSVVLFCVLLFRICLTETNKDEAEENTALAEDPELILKHSDVVDDVEATLNNLQATGRQAQSLNNEGVLPSVESDNLYNEMAELFHELVEKAREPAYASNFLNAKGIDRIIIPNLKVKNSKFREQLLILLKVLYDVAPITTNSVIPMTVLDRLLDIFEYDDNLAMKAYALDILQAWLPGNPKAQIRVMKLKGLEPFYHQVSKLDRSVIASLLDLFNTILVEHIEMRGKGYEGALDPKILILYRRIGLIERMSTPEVCNGLLNIFQSMWAYTADDSEVIVPVFQLIKNIKPFCVNVLKGKSKAVKLFEALLKYIDDDFKKDYFEKLSLNVFDLKTVLDDYLDELKHPPQKDEF